VLGLPRHHRWQANCNHQLQDLDLDSGHNSVEHRPKSPPAAPTFSFFYLFLARYPKTCVSFFEPSCSFIVIFRVFAFLSISNLRVHCHRISNLRVHCHQVHSFTAFTKTKASSNGETQIKSNQTKFPFQVPSLRLWSPCLNNVFCHRVCYIPQSPNRHRCFTPSVSAEVSFSLVSAFMTCWCC
jgi:hypothetical protein